MQVVVASALIADSQVSASVLQTSELSATNELLLHTDSHRDGNLDQVVETATRGLDVASQQLSNFHTQLAGDRSHLLLLFALLVLINLIVIVGNILVILAVYATAKLRNVTNIFIVSLATADLMLGLFVLPYALLFEVLDVWIFGEIWCRGWLVTDVWISTASILNLCAISVDRYVAVTRPVKYRSIMTARRARTLVGCVWVVSFLICFPPLLQHWTPSTLSSSSSQTVSVSVFVADQQSATPTAGPLPTSVPDTELGLRGSGAAPIGGAEEDEEEPRRRRRRSLIEVTLGKATDKRNSRFRTPSSLTSRGIIWDSQLMLLPSPPQENRHNNTSSQNNNNNNNSSNNNNAQPGQLTLPNNKGKKNDIKAAYKEGARGGGGGGEAITVIDNKLRESSSKLRDSSDREQYISIAPSTVGSSTSTSTSSSPSDQAMENEKANEEIENKSMRVLVEWLPKEGQTVDRLKGFISTYQSAALSQLLSRAQNDVTIKQAKLSDDSLVNDLDRHRLKAASLPALAQLDNPPAKTDVADKAAPRLLTLLAARAIAGSEGVASVDQLVKRRRIRSSALVVGGGGASAAQRTQPNNIRSKRINSHWPLETSRPTSCSTEGAYCSQPISDLLPQQLRPTFAEYLIDDSTTGLRYRTQNKREASVRQAEFLSSSHTGATTRKTTRYHSASSDAPELSGSIHSDMSLLDDIDYYARTDSGHVVVSLWPKVANTLYEDSSKREKYLQGESTRRSRRGKRALKLDRFSSEMNDDNNDSMANITQTSLPERRKKLGCALFEDKTYVIYSALGSFYIPMLVMVFFYSRIYLVASRAQKALQRGYMTTKWPSGNKLLTAGSNSTSACGKRVGSGKSSFGNFSSGDQFASSPGGCERVTLRIHRREKGSLPPISPTATPRSYQGSLPNSPKTFRPNSNELDKLLKLTRQLEQSAQSCQQNSHSLYSSTDQQKCDDKTTGERQQLLERKVEMQPKTTNEENPSVNESIVDTETLPRSTSAEQVTFTSAVQHHKQQHRKKHHHSHTHCHHHHQQHHHHNHSHHHHRQHQQQQQHRHKCSHNHSHLTHRERCQHRKSVTSGRHDQKVERLQSTLCSSIVEEQAVASSGGRELQQRTSAHNEIGDSLASSAHSVQIMISQYNEEEGKGEKEDGKSNVSIDLICPQTTASPLNTSCTLKSERQPVRVDRSQSCGPVDTPSIIVSWNPSTVSTGAEVQVSIVKQASEQLLEKGRRESTSNRLLSTRSGSRSAGGSKTNTACGSQGSGLSLIASLPQAANQVRKQSMMLLSSITSKSSQTLRRLSVVASHPVDSLLQRSHANSVSNLSSSSSSSFSVSENLEAPNEFGSLRKNEEEDVTVDEQPEDQKRRRSSRKRHHKKRKKKSKKGKRRDSTTKKTFDDYLMAVAGIDRSSDDDDNDEDEDEMVDEEDEVSDTVASVSEQISRIEYPPLLHSLHCCSSLSPKPIPLVDQELALDEKPPSEGANAQEERARVIELYSSREEGEGEKDNNNQVQPDIQENIARPPSALQRKGACYERATSRASAVCDRPSLSMVSTIRQTLNGFSNLSANPKGGSETKASTFSSAIRLEAPNSDQQQSDLSKGNINVNSKVRRRPAKRTSRWHAKRLHAETKAAKTVAVIVGGFIFCWLPFFTAYLSRAIICERPDCIPQSLLSLFIWLGYLNSAINPVIYGLLSADFRHAFKNILCRCRFRSNDDTVVVSVLVDSIIKSIL